MRIFPRVKICGITNSDDALFCAFSGADALGFVFADSKRKVEPEKVREIVELLPPFVTSVGVFMDQSIDFVIKAASVSKINVIQLHGDEDADFIEKLGMPVIKRIKIFGSHTKDYALNTAAGIKVCGYILDPGAGQGIHFNWENFRNIPINKRIIIAGGLTPDNVREAVKIIRPYGVDVSSGVEKSPGIKDHKKIKKFITEVKCALM